jgi:cytoskeletal protein CcmA (bactofilin family)
MDERRKTAWIGGAVLVKGAIVSTEDLIIDGRVEGTIELGDHHLTLGEHSSIVADLVAKTVTISGTVKGSVIGGAKVELRKTANIEGDVTAPKLVIEDGAVLRGKVDTGMKKT